MNKWCVILLPLLVGTLTAQEIHLRNRTIRGDEPARADSPSGGAAQHRILQFDHSPNTEDFEGLLKDGYTVVSVLPDNGVVVATASGAVTARAGMRWTGILNPADKLSPELPLQDSVNAIIEFHSDIDIAQQDVVASQENLTLARPPVLTAYHALITTSPDRLLALAAHDEVAYIFPADPTLLSDDSFKPCAGMLTANGAIPQFANIVHGWDPDPDGVLRLGYVFGSITPKVPAATVRSEVLRALNEWSKVANVVFQPAASAGAARTISIKFASGSHGDAYPFDGPGGVLAHTFYPVPLNSEPLAGDMHLDGDENWHTGNDLDIYSVALHEAGHALGLGHSDKPGDVMYPYYHQGMHLSANDIGAIQSLYGAPTGTVATPAPAPAPVSAPVTPPVTVSTLHLTVDSQATTTNSSVASFSGAITGGVQPITVQWQTDHGYGGVAVASGAGWLAKGISLVNGSNTISITAFDAAKHTATQTVTVTLATPPATTSAAPGGSVPVSVAITSPSSAVTTANGTTIALAGTAAGGQGISRVSWQTSGGATGTATGASPWLASGVPLLAGTNTILVKAYDPKGNSGWSTLVVVRH